MVCGPDGDGTVGLEEMHWLDDILDGILHKNAGASSLISTTDVSEHVELDLGPAPNQTLPRSTYSTISTQSLVSHTTQYGISNNNNNYASKPAVA